MSFRLENSLKVREANYYVRNILKLNEYGQVISITEESVLEESGEMRRCKGYG
jgi:hypothetical protein